MPLRLANNNYYVEKGERNESWKNVQLKSNWVGYCGTSYNLNIWKTDIGGSKILEQPGLCNNILSKQNKIILNKNKTKQETYTRAEIKR